VVALLLYVSGCGSTLDLTIVNATGASVLVGYDIGAVGGKVDITTEGEDDGSGAVREGCINEDNAFGIVEDGPYVFCTCTVGALDITINPLLSTFTSSKLSFGGVFVLKFSIGIIAIVVTQTTTTTNMKQMIYRSRIWSKHDDSFLQHSFGESVVSVS